MLLWKICVGEILGTMTLIAFGNGVGSNATYRNSKGYKTGWLGISFGWGLGVFLGVIVANIFGTGGHLNPAVTIANIVGGPNHHGITVTEGLVYLISELIGATLGQIIVDIMFFDQIKKADSATVLSTHATTAINPSRVLPNMFTEFIGTCALLGSALFAVRYFGFTNEAVGKFVGPFAVGATVTAIGLCFGGTTGYAINPARDLMPRVVHATMYRIIPSLKNTPNIKSNWSYAPIPVLAPISAGLFMGGLLYVS